VPNQRFDISKVHHLPERLPKGMKPETKKRGPAWMTQVLLGALVWGLGTGAYGEPFP
jgi:hypothetical protein